MRRRLTISQRQALLKAGCLLLSVTLFIGALMSIPYIVGALPRIDGAVTPNLFYGAELASKAKPVYALGAGSFSSEESSADESQTDPNGEYEPEPPIPIPSPGENDLSVSASNFCWYEVGETPTLNINNHTKYKVELTDYLKKTFTVNGSFSETEPLVLIIHTHGSESYLPEGYDFYSPDETFRSLNESETVVHIGQILCETLNLLGINTVHDSTMYDLTDFNKSYNYSREGIKNALEKYPSVQFVIDLHRDSIFDSNGNNIKPLTRIDGNDCAQLMLVIGTDEGGANHPDWRDNLTFATHLQQKMNDLYPTLARPINLRSAAFNQALTKGSVILEVGACGNTITEAENAVLLFAQAYASLLKENMN